jgi:hypothetical protein
MLNYYWKIEMNKTKINKTTTTLISFLIVLLATNMLLADNKIRSPRAKERMNMVKKMKMIEVMELDEAKSEKFLAKFNAYSKQLEDKRKQHRELVNKLDDAMKNNSKEVPALTEQLLNSQDELNKINSEKTRDLRTILSETEFAKYLVFENNFINEVFNCFMNHNQHNDMKGNAKFKLKEFKKEVKKLRKKDNNTKEENKQDKD